MPLMTREQEDWLSGDDTAEASAITERPAPAFWRCDGEEAEPLPFATLIEASDAKPATPEAMIAGGGVILAESAQDVCQWIFSEAGMRRLDEEMARTMERDSDTALRVILAVDFELAMVGS